MDMTTDAAATTANPDDSEIRASLLELDLPTDRREAPAAPPAPPVLPVAPEASAPAAQVNPIGAALTPAPLRSRAARGATASRNVAAIRNGATAGAAALTPAMQARVAEAAAQATARRALDDAITVALGGDTATDYPHGCLVGWYPAGDQSWSTIAAASAAAGVAPPAQRSDRAIASAAVRKLKSEGYEIDTITNGSEWIVYAPAGVAEVGAPVGNTSLVAKLVGEDLTLTGPDVLCAVVRAAWDLARETAKIGTTEITAWLGAMLAGWRAVPVAVGRFLPPGPHVEIWLRLANALADVGVKVPRRPAGIIRREDIADEIQMGLRVEVETAITEITRERDRALARETARAEDKGRPVDAKRATLGEVAALSAMVMIDECRSKLGLYEVIAGPMTDARRALDELAASLQTLVSDGAIRGAMLELYDAPGVAGAA